MQQVWNYLIVREELSHPDIGDYVTYGIRILRREGASWLEVTTIHDVTSEGVLASRIAELFNRYQLSPIHSMEAIDNMLSQ